VTATEMLLRFAIALFIGLLIGLERGWHERDSKEGSRIAGMRTFALIKPPTKTSNGIQVHQAPLSHIDIAAAVLDLKTMPLPDDFQGVSPFDKANHKPVFMHTNAIVKQNGVVDWPWKLLHTYYPSERMELYDLEQDSSESNDLSAVRPDMVKRLEERLSSWVVEQVVYYSDPVYYTNLAPPKPVN